MIKPRYVIQVQCTNLRLALHVNDIPAEFLAVGEALAPVKIPLNEFLVRGANVLDIVVHPGPIPSREEEPWQGTPQAAIYKGKGSFTLQVFQEDLTQTQIGASLVTHQWEGDAVPQPLRQTQPFQIAESFGPWAWQTATQFPAVTPAVQRDVLQYLEFLHGVLSLKNFARFVQESEIKLREITEMAYGIPHESISQGMLEMLQTSSELPGQLRPLEPEQIDLHLVANGRMIDCRRKDRTYVLEYTKPKSEDRSFFPTVIGQIQNKWHILR